MKGSRSWRSGRLALWGPVVIWAAVIAAATSTPGSKLPPPPIPFFDLGVHLFLYGVLGVLLCRAIYRGTRLGASWWAWSGAFGIAQLYGVLDEIHQIWIPDRYCTIGDALADGVGAAVGIGLYFCWTIRQFRRAGFSSTDPRR